MHSAETKLEVLENLIQSKVKILQKLMNEPKPHSDYMQTRREGRDQALELAIYEYEKLLDVIEQA